jgi:hypothetical protein
LEVNMLAIRGTCKSCGCTYAAVGNEREALRRVFKEARCYNCDVPFHRKGMLLKVAADPAERSTKRNLPFVQIPHALRGTS